MSQIHCLDGFTTYSGDIVVSGGIENTAGYADDTFLVAQSHKDLQTLTDRAALFLDFNGVKINYKKSYYSHIGDSQDLVITIPDSTGTRNPCQILPPHKPYHYLGTFITLTLDWRPHLTNIANKFLTVFSHVQAANITFLECKYIIQACIGGMANAFFYYLDIPQSTLNK